MNIELLREICISQPGVEESFPFDNDTLVFKVGGKMFALTSLKEPVSVNLKGTPELNEEWRQQYGAVTPGYHMNKTHWNTVQFNDDVLDADLIKMVLHSYELVKASLPKKIKETLQ
jgi:predicted DNA-binding protein (MmcQ/YjbR family)